MRWTHIARSKTFPSSHCRHWRSRVCSQSYNPHSKISGLEQQRELGRFSILQKDRVMPTESPSQRKTTGRVTHEFKHGELKSGPDGKGGKVKSRKQAIAIALKEAGASKYESKSKNRK